MPEKHEPDKPKPEQKPEPKSEKQPKKLDILDQVLQMPEEKMLPWEEIILPSHGVYYDGEIPDGRIQVRPMGLDAEKVLSTTRLAQSGKSIDHLFRKCVQFPNSNFNPLNLLAGDRVFLLYYLRGITHGNVYEFIIKCTNEDCGNNGTFEYDLNRLQDTITGPPELGVEPFKVVLPHLSRVLGKEFWVRVRFMRGYDMQSMLTRSKVKRRAQGVGRNPGARYVDETIDNTLEDNLNMLIVDAAGSTDKSKITKLIKRMHASDTAAIREFLRKNSPGVDTTIMINCPDCGTEMRMELPITESFFRPAATESA
jgi:hypothetical protein